VLREAEETAPVSHGIQIDAMVLFLDGGLSFKALL
jgi:hypothetical protein